MLLLSEWVAATYPHALIFTRIRLGAGPPLPEGVELGSPEHRAMSHWRRWADAVVIDDTTLRVIEAKIRPDVGVIGQLELYIRLVPSTWELRDYADRRIVPVLLCAVHDPQLAALAGEKGFEYHIYKPEWVDAYLDTLYPRERRAKGGR
jgi:hypothetical protein